MSLLQWIIVAMFVYAALDGIVYYRWIRRANAARDAGETPPPRPRWWL
jgi:hypothetical protein